MTHRLSMTARAALLVLSWSAAETTLSRAAAQAAPQSPAVAAGDPGSQTVRRAHEPPQRVPGATVSAQRLIGSGLIDADGQRVGAIRDVLFGPDGRATAVVVSGGYLLSLGRTHYRIAWSDLRFSDDALTVSAAVRLADMKSYAWTRRGAARRADEMRARSLLRRRVTLENGSRYGRVRDVVFGKSGRLDGLLIVPTHRLGDRRGDRNPRLYGKRFEVESGRIRLPYARDAL